VPKIYLVADQVKVQEASQNVKGHVHTVDQIEFKNLLEMHMGHLATDQGELYAPSQSVQRQIPRRTWS
jgi:hypothetical protein